MDSYRNTLGNMTVEEFDALCTHGEDHVFSISYQRRKAELLRGLEQSPVRAIPNSSRSTTMQTQQRRPHIPRLAVAAVVVLCLALPVGAWAAGNIVEFFNGAFGTGWRTSQPAIERVQEIEGKAPVNVIYPASDVVPVDQEVAQRLLADAASTEEVSFTAPDGHELTITQAVRSKHAMVYAFTLHREGGVTALVWDEKTNNVAAKGAYMPHDQQFSWAAPGDDFLYIDPTASTEDTLIGYGYTVFGKELSDGTNPQFAIYTWDVPLDVSEEDQSHVDMLEVPCAMPVESLVFANPEGGLAEVSPLGLALDSETGLFETMADGYNMSADPVFIETITLYMADGSTYVVRDGKNNIDNTLSLCGFSPEAEGEVHVLNMAFNRLVDPALVEYVEVVAADASGESNIDDFLPDSEQGEMPSKVVTYHAA